MSDSHHPTSPEDPHAVPHDAAHAQKHAFLYLGIGSLLIFCTGLTVALSYVPLGKWNMLVGMLLATFKAGCVAAVFMHLWSEKWTIYRVLLVTIFFAIGLFALTGLAFHDPIHFPGFSTKF